MICSVEDSVRKGSLESTVEEEARDRRFHGLHEDEHSSWFSGGHPGALVEAAGRQEARRNRVGGKVSRGCGGPQSGFESCLHAFSLRLPVLHLASVNW